MSRTRPSPPGLIDAVPPRRVPGEAGLWVLVFGDLFAFAIFFATFAYYRLVEPETFRASQAALDQSLGLVNTLLLLTSSLMVVKAVEAGRAGDRHRARRFTLATIALGLSFAGVKILEYIQKIDEGIRPTANNFFTFYFVLTGIHLLHVVVGLGVLAFLQWRFARKSAGADAVADGCAIYWHMVDVIWVVLFAIFYLHR